MTSERDLYVSEVLEQYLNPKPRTLPCTPATFRWQIGDVAMFPGKVKFFLAPVEIDWTTGVLPPSEPMQAVCCSRCGGAVSTLPVSSRRLAHNLCECDVPLPPVRPLQELLK